jgi:hypothetical protein
MYKVVLTTHFDCWFVGDSDIGVKENLKEAIELFLSTCEAGFESEYSCIDDYIVECCFEDDSYLDIYDCGFIVCINKNDNEIIASKNFNYDPINHSIEDPIQIDFYLDDLDESEIQIIFDLGYIL